MVFKSSSKNSLTGEFNSQTQLRDPVDESYISSSSSDESDCEAVSQPSQLVGNSAQELTLVDDDAPLLVFPSEEAGEGDDNATEGTTTAYNEDEDELDGEGAEEEESKLTIGAEDDTKEKKKKKKKRKKWLTICLSNCKYDVVRRTSRKYGFREVSDEDDWTLYWTDFSVALERVMDMKKYQKINHFPGMSEICRKDMLARNMNRMQKLFPKEYNVFPKTWCLPADYGDFQAYTRQKKNKTYILKPESGCQGRGIWVTKYPKDIKPNEHMICQVYITRPFLIDGFKFDLRVYTLVTSCDPFRIFVFKDGLARFATFKYSEPNHNNTDNVYMHLTNYAINKHSQDFVRDDEAGSKRRISTINKYLRENGYDVDKLWSDIDDVIIKTLISAHSVLKHNYRTCFPNHVKGSACFEILGFDIIFDRKLKPIVLEVNHSPSFTTDADIDREIKGALIWDTLGLVNFGAVDRRKCVEEEKRRIKDRLLGKYVKKETKEELEAAYNQYLEQLEKYEEKHMGNYRRIYPIPGTERYDKYFHSSGSLFQETAAFKARQEMARQQREEIMRKKEKNEMMLKGKAKKDMLRPESPGRRRRKLSSRPTLPLRHIGNQQMPNNEPTNGTAILYDVKECEPVDTKKPQDIVEEEELERLSGLLQRDNLVRGLGVVEHAYRLLHSTPGILNNARSDQRGHGLTGQGHFHTLTAGHSKMALRLELAKQELEMMKPIPNKAKDTHYYKCLLDRYFGPNHVLCKEGSFQRLQRCLSSISSPGVQFKKSSDYQFPHIRFSRTVASHTPSDQVYVNQELPPQMDVIIGKPSYIQKTPNRVLPTTNQNDRSFQHYQRSRVTKKALGAASRPGPIVASIQEMDYRNMANLIDAKSGYQLEWRSDLSTPSRGRSLSAKQKEQDLSQTLSQGLSVVSAPAPVVYKPDISMSLNKGNNKLYTAQATDNQKSPNTQRLRNIPNNMPFRKLEINDNNAFVFGQ
ncbi:tubulin polyglutamylase ttll6-like isoform X2 [Biomphalaria glabrata]|uniref:Tubulin polyglutamylase ttll6-like isoform X2 n=1 Tax=Biomphalaria glabrata TaxID=6526 RepID=A0A9U8EJ48_BIOGL|nr:tubulin polyglutamylase ttll6-like isoform X2 [Biomphalaria glabrata]